MLAELFTSKTRVRLLTKLFLNPQVSGYLRELSGEFSISPGAVKDELDRLSGAGYLTKRQEGRKISYRADTSHPLFPEIHSIIKKYLGIDRIIEKIMDGLGAVEAVYILDDYAQGKDSGLIDVLVVGNVNERRLEATRKGVERKINRKIRVVALTPGEFAEHGPVFLARPHWQVV